MQNILSKVLGKDEIVQPWTRNKVSIERVEIINIVKSIG
ncbi:hypothetical protein B0H69_004879 [Clostridium beijerinckii]|nr:hypothetical protein [Clostridium beijerinckii]NRU48471.1 hypothetical protein [Clostridium beijerinckii]NRZ33526.1 hypothetical protein [Clostridium beijerinckii]NSA12738.1 hypothetical protein [Clostridium beijerinckii]NSA62556.1 hypothetical protein [Clostridium beijerinckii]